MSGSVRVTDFGGCDIEQKEPSTEKRERTYHQVKAGQTLEVGLKEIQSGTRTVNAKLGNQKNNPCNNDPNVPLSPPGGGKK